MSAHPRVELCCDVCETEFYQCLDSSVRVARKEAARLGWTWKRERGDACPECSTGQSAGRAGGEHG